MTTENVLGAALVNILLTARGLVLAFPGGTILVALSCNASTVSGVAWVDARLQATRASTPRPPARGCTHKFGAVGFGD